MEKFNMPESFASGMMRCDFDVLNIVWLNYYGMSECQKHLWDVLNIIWLNYCNM